MAIFSTGTQRIVDAHRNDFTYDTFDSFMKKAGGYNAYVKSLGGVFAKYIGKQPHVKTVQEFQEVAEYVMGLLTIWGVNYWNGGTHWKWGQNLNKGNYTADAFRQGSQRADAWRSDVDRNLSDKKYAATNCNAGVDMLEKKCGIHPYQSAYFKSGNKIITDRKDLKVGDRVHFFKKKMTSTDKGTWSSKLWRHVAIVGEVTDTTVTFYDFGNRFVRNRNPKWTFPRTSLKFTQSMGGTYSGYGGWIGMRVNDLQDVPVKSTKGKSPSDLAVETIKGLWGSGDARKAALGSLYDGTQKLVNTYLKEGGRTDYIRACAFYVLKGYAGSGDTRKEFFGKDYDGVQDKVNSVCDTAQNVVRGFYGNGDERKEKLGADYGIVQYQVNKVLKG